MIKENPCKNCITFSICVNKLQDTYTYQIGERKLDTNEDEDVLKENLRYCIIGLSIPCSILEQYLFYNGNESKYYRYVKRMGLMIDYYYDYMEK